MNIKKETALKLTKTVILIIIITITLGSCRKSNDVIINQGPSEGFTITNHQVSDISSVMDQIMNTEDIPDVYDYHDFYFDIVQNAPGDLFYLIAHDKVLYTSKDDYGNDIQLTGLFIYPFRLSGRKVVAPIISLNHGLELLKKYAPSKWESAEWHPKEWGNFAEVLIADIMAISYGWVIVMPDYQGMGDDLSENHPCCIREKLAVATADMVQTGINTIKDNRHEYVNWDGNVFLYGYSEGGFVTMSATRELEKRKVNLSGTVCMGGPYDLSGTMIDVMLSDEPFPAPYFLPLMLVGYNTIYNSIYNYDIMLKEEYRTNIPKYTNGFYSTEVVDSIMPQSRILKEVFTASFIDSLKDHNSQVFNTLYSNNSYTWQPKTPMLLWHCKNDDCVPIGNFVTAKGYFESTNATNIEYVEYPPFPNWEGTVHVSVAPVAFKEGADWIHNQLKK